MDYIMKMGLLLGGIAVELAQTTQDSSCLAQVVVDLVNVCFLLHPHF